MKNNFLFYIGNALMIISICSLIYIFFPFAMIYLNPPRIQSLADKKETYITIKKINAQSVISENIDPQNKVEYHKALKKSVAHAKGTVLPGEPGTSFVFAHSSGPPWEQTRYNTIFLRLNELKNGDEIEIQRKGKVFKYLVRDKKEVEPNQVQYLGKNERNQLILQTCTPIGTDLKRLLIFADPI